MRDYRNKILSVGQNSGTYLSDFVIQMIKALDINELDSIADIGCGNGTHAELLKKKFSNSNIYGVDFAPKTITYLNNNKRDIFKKIIYASTAKIPLANKSVTLVLTMENLEHLYHNDIENAFKELVRISDFIIITIPIITHIVNIPWLTGEIKEAINDSIDLSEIEYESLAACVHKTGFYEESLIEAGLSKLNTEKFNIFAFIIF